MDVTVGTLLPEWTLDPVSGERMKLLAAILRDPNPIHWDAGEVARRGLGHRVINQGPTNLGYVTNMLMAWAGPTCIRRLQARFTSNVFEGDRVVAGGQVTAVHERDGERLVDCEVWLDRGDGTRAVAGVATVALGSPGEPLARTSTKRPVEFTPRAAACSHTDRGEPVSDHDAITQLFATYAWAHDNKEFELLDDVFTEQSEFTVDITGGPTIGPLRSRRETCDFIRETTIDQGDQRRHVITNVRFSNDTATETRVTAILSLFVTLDNVLTVQATGWYDCQAVLDDGTWRFSRLYLTLDRTYES